LRQEFDDKKMHNAPEATMTRRYMRTGGPAGTPPPPEDGDAVKRFFARKLVDLMTAKGMRKQATLAQALTEMAGFEVSRSTVHNWVRGKALADDRHLSLICDFFKVKPTDLLPAAAEGIEVNTENNPMSLRTLTDGKVWLRINQAVTMAQATAIIGIINSGAN
jgi:transcriptional regulator with XRE-family HTH domain